MLKDQLLAESKTIDTEIKLDGIFEGVELTESTKSKFEIVFAESVKKRALQLAESHIKDIAEKADEKVEDEVEKKTKEKEEKLKETCDKFFEHLATEWLKENTVAIDRSIKADLFESIMVGMKGLFVDHNVIIPESAVDVVAELEESLEETKTEASKLFDQLQESKAETVALKRSTMLEKATVGLTESQKEKVSDLIEGVEFDDKFEAKLTAMVEMAQVKATTVPQKEAPIVENLNFKPEPLVENAKTAPSEDPEMDMYVSAVKNYA